MNVKKAVSSNTHNLCQILHLTFNDLVTVLVIYITVDIAVVYNAVCI